MKKVYLLSFVLALILAFPLFNTMAMAADSEDLTITVSYRIYDRESEDSGASHYDLTSAYTVETRTIVVPAGQNRSVEVPLEGDWGVLRTFVPTGISKDDYYNESGNISFSISDSYTSNTANITIYVGKDWTSRFVLYGYAADDGVSFEFIERPVQTAAAPAGGNLEDSNNYQSQVVNNQIEQSSMDVKGVKPNPPEGYYYAGKYSFSYIRGGQTTYVNPEDYGFSVNEETGEITGPTVKLTGNELFRVVYYYVKDGEELRGTFFRYNYFDNEWDNNTIIENPVVGSDVSLTPEVFEGYKFVSKRVARWQNSAWQSYPYDEATDTVKQIDGYLAVYNYYEKADEYTVTYVSNENGDGQGTTYDGGSVYEMASYTVLGNDVVQFRKTGSRFDGWNTEADGSGEAYNADDVFTMPSENVTLYAQWKRTGGGGSNVSDYILTYESNGGTTYPSESHAANSLVNLDKVPFRSGYTFTGWYADSELTEKITRVTMDSSKTVYAGWEASVVPPDLNGEDHYAYIIGYPDGTVQPMGNITRAEVAAIFFRLLQDEARDGNLTTTNNFVDVNAGEWYNTSVSTLTKLDIIKGMTTTEFAPNAPITRAQFAAICARFDTGKTEGISNFSDISGHWAEEEIERAVSLGWIAGYEDGTFRPDQPITRAEAMTIINRVLVRIPENASDLLDGMNEWIDNQPDTWYYLAVQEATNSHDYEMKNDINETWTELNEDPDWSRYNN